MKLCKACQKKLKSLDDLGVVHCGSCGKACVDHTNNVCSACWHKRAERHNADAEREHASNILAWKRIQELEIELIKARRTIMYRLFGLPRKRGNNK